MAALAHLGVGLAAKRVAPGAPVLLLVLGAFAIDLVWTLLLLVGVEKMPGPGVVSPYSHGLLMATLWSVLVALVAGFVWKRPRVALFAGLLVFSHWVVDFITHPMTHLFPGAMGPPLLFEGSRTVGLGLYSTALGTYLGEYGTLLAGFAIYAWARRRLREQASDGAARAAVPQGPR